MNDESKNHKEEDRLIANTAREKMILKLALDFIDRCREDLEKLAGE